MSFIPERGGYSAGHPWYYVLGGHVPRLREIRDHAIIKGYRCYLTDEIQAAHEKPEPARSAAIAELIETVTAELRRDVSGYRRAARELGTARAEQQGSDVKTICDSVHVAISLKFNHLINDFTHLHALQNLPKQLDLFGR